MMRLTTIVAAAAMTVGGMAFLGCESSNPSGSNGEFGESPSQAGEYAQPSTNPRSDMPTTRPAPDANPAEPAQ
jgi:hypothetical protein